MSFSYRYISINNHDATKRIKSINTKHKDNPNIIAQTNALKYVLDTFMLIETNKNHHSINALLHLLYDWKFPEYVESIWKDIQLYHRQLQSYRNKESKLSYAILMKCLIKTESVGIDKCIQTLSWMQKYQYKLSIHGSLLNQLIAKCRKNHNLQSLKYIHSLINNQLIEVNKDDIIIKTVLINAYGVCAATDDALQIFNSIEDKDKNDVSIGAMMKVYVNNGYNRDAFILYDKYKENDDPVLHRLALRACINTNDFAKGIKLHAKLADMFSDNIYIKITLITFYGHFKDISMAQKLFESIKQHRNVFAINAMIKAYINNGYADDALSLFKEYNNIMDDVSYGLIIKACADCNDYITGRDVINSNKNTIIKSENMMLKAALIEFYGKLGNISAAWKMFRSIKTDQMDTYCVNAMLSALVSTGNYQQALQFYTQYVPFIDSFSHTMAIKACIGTENIEKGYDIIDKLNNNNSIQSKNVLIEYYGHFGDISKALNLFNSISMEDKDGISVSAMMAAYIKNEHFDQALDLYHTYYKLNDDISHVLALKACVYLKDFVRGRCIIRDNKLERSDNIQIKNSLISFYGNCDEIHNAQKIFSNVQNKDIVTINAMMDAYRECNLYSECIQLFDDIPSSKSYQVDRDLISFIIAIKACTQGTLLHHGERVHSQLKRYRNHKELRDISVQINLINMYGKCGKFEECDKIFDDIRSEETEKFKNEIIIWNAMIHAYGRNGRLSKVKQIYELLMEIGVIPNRKTYELLINAYSQCGDVYAAQKLWNEEIDETMKHDEDVITALIDGMSRKGLLDEVMVILKENESFITDCYAVWMSVLSGCRRYRNLELAQQVYQIIIDKFNNDESVMIAASTLMCNIYGSTGELYKRNKVIQDLKNRGFKTDNLSLDGDSCEFKFNQCPLKTLSS